MSVSGGVGQALRLSSSSSVMCSTSGLVAICHGGITEAKLGAAGN